MSKLDRLAEENSLLRQQYDHHSRKLVDYASTVRDLHQLLAEALVLAEEALGLTKSCGVERDELQRQLAEAKAAKEAEHDALLNFVAGTGQVLSRALGRPVVLNTGNPETVKYHIGLLEQQLTEAHACIAEMRGSQ